MLSINHIQYLFQDVFGIDSSLVKRCSIENDIIHIQFENTDYTEACFDFDNPELSESDFEILETIFFEIIKNKANDSALLQLYKNISTQDIPFLKFTHYFVNEHYFGKPIRVDNHNRVTSDSIFKNIQKYLSYPIVDLLIDAFTYTFLQTEKRVRTIYFTSDFDFINLWSYLGFFKTIWRFIKHIIYLRRMLFIEEFWSVILSKRYLLRNVMLTKSMFLFKENISSSLTVKNIGFLLVEKSNKKYDFKNDYFQLSFKEYLNRVMGNVSFGIHPSYNTRYKYDSLKKQIEIVEQIIFEHPKYSRFHYLNCSYPDDLLPLEKNGIKQDFSFYFCDSLLFRGAISRPFKQWSYKENRAIKIEIIPLTIMDVTLRNTLKLKYDEAKKISFEKIKNSLLIGQTCVLLWHNNEMYEPLNHKSYSRKIMLSIKNYVEEIGNIR